MLPLSVWSSILLGLAATTCCCGEAGWFPKQPSDIDDVVNQLSHDDAQIVTTALKKLTHMNSELWLDAFAKAQAEGNSLLDEQEKFGQAVLEKMKDSEARMQENKRYVGELGGIEAVLAAMHRFSNDTTLQSAGCAALGQFGFKIKDNALKISDLGGIFTIVAAMRNHPNDEGLQMNAYKALNALEMTCKEVKSEVERAGGLTMAKSFLQEYSPESFVAQGARKLVKRHDHFLLRWLQNSPFAPF